MEEFFSDLRTLFWFSPFETTHDGLLWCAFLAAVLTMLYFLLRRARLGAAIEALLKGGCTDEKTARPAAALSEKKSVRRALLKTKDRLFERVQEEGEAPRFYLPADRMDKAKYFQKASRFSAGKGIGFLLIFYAALLMLHHLWPLIEKIWN